MAERLLSGAGGDLLFGAGPGAGGADDERAGVDLPLEDTPVDDGSYEDAVAMQRRLTREEGLLSGISTGAIAHAAAKVAAQLGAGKTVVAEYAFAMALR